MGLDLPREAYHKSKHSHKGRVHSTFRGYLPRIVGGEILDAGCSYGETTGELKRLYPDCRVIGMDVNPEVISIAERDSEFPLGAVADAFIVGDIYQPPFEGYSFDAVFCMNNIAIVLREHPELVKLARHLTTPIWKTIKRGGYWLVSDNSEFFIAQKGEQDKANLVAHVEDVNFNFIRSHLLSPVS